MITLSSDFGWPYPASMKGVILQKTDARLVDVSHDFPRQDVRATGFWLREVLPYFPPAVHLVVVDPGVGTDRAALAIRAGDHALVGPDNGVLLPAARELTDGSLEVFEVVYEDPTPDGPTENGRWPPVAETSTFHGRDVFAPAAAQVQATGIEEFEDAPGFEPVSDYEEVTFPEPTVEDDSAVGEAITVDGFGNVITNIPGEVLTDQFDSHVKANGVWASARRAYAEVEPGHRVVTVGSHGNVELAVNQGRGDETFGVDAGGRVRLAW